MSEDESVKISQYDGTSNATAECKFCKLDVDDHYLTQSGLCKSCRNLSVIISLDKGFKRLIMPGILFLLFSFFVPELRSFIFPVLIILFGPSFLLSSLQKKIHYYGIIEEHRITSLLRMYNRLSDRGYYTMSLNLWNEHYTKLSDHHHQIILTELVESVFLSEKSNPTNIISDWARPTGMTNEEFIELLIDKANLLDALSVYEGTGVLPDLWENLTDDNRKEQILDVLVENIEEEFHNASSEERHVFLEDIYLISDELEDFIGENEKWFIILDKLDGFEPETPPKNIFQQAQLQALSKRPVEPESTD